MPKVISVVVPAYNEQELIAGCLDSLLKQSLGTEKFEIIVVDNNSTDLTVKIALDKGVRVVQEHRKGYVHAIRKGIEAADTDIVAFTDADCRVPVDWLQKFLDDFASSPEVIAVGGKLSFYDLHPIFNRFLWYFMYFPRALPGNNMAILCKALQQIGGIDPHINLAVDFWLTTALRRSKLGKLFIDRHLVVQTSGRRFRGSFSSDVKYAINVISIFFTSRPLFYDFPDVRERAQL